MGKEQRYQNAASQLASGRRKRKCGQRSSLRDQIATGIKR